MSALREAAQQALEALDVASSCLDGYYIPRGMTTLPEIETASIALRAALEQEQAEPKPMHPELRKMWEEHFDRCFRAMPLPAQEQAEHLNLSDRAVQRRLAAQWGYVPAAQAEPVEPVEPVAWMVYTEGGTSAYVTDNPTDLVGAYRALSLYTAPPQRTMVPLTEKEIMHIGMTHQSLRQVVRAVERAHGIKE